MLNDLELFVLYLILMKAICSKLPDVGFDDSIGQKGAVYDIYLYMNSRNVSRKYNDNKHSEYSSNPTYINDDKQCPYTFHIACEYFFLSFNCVLPKGGLEGVG